MMSVEEYALDINRDISVVLKKCKELGIDAKENDDLLDDEGITMLDNAFANEPEEEVIEDEIEDEIPEEPTEIEEDEFSDEIPEESTEIDEDEEEEE